MRLPQSNHLLSISCLPSSFSVRICQKIPSLFSHRGEEVPFSFPSMPSAAPFCKYNNLNIYQSFYVQHHKSLTLIWQFGSYVYIQQDQRKALRRSYTFSQSVRQSFGCLCSDSLCICTLNSCILLFLNLRKKIAKLILLCT